MSSAACCTSGVPTSAAGMGGRGEFVDLEVDGAPTRVRCYRTGLVGAGEGGGAGEGACVVVVPDIFGVEHANTVHTCDMLASGLGCVVLMPDFFKGDAWPVSDFPPADGARFGAWLDAAGSWEACRGTLRAAKVVAAREHGAGRVACVGMCWGASVACEASCEGSFWLGAVGAHPARVKPESVRDACGPIMLMPTKGDNVDPLVEGMAKLHARDGVSRITEGYLEQQHGFLAARGDYANVEADRHAIDRAVAEIVGFLGPLLSGGLQPGAVDHD